MLGGHVRIPIGDGGAYWLADLGSDVGPGTIRIEVLDRDVAFVELLWMLVDDPTEMVQAPPDPTDPATTRLVTSRGLEVRDSRGLSTLISDRPMGYTVVVRRENSVAGADHERHEVVLWPDAYDHLRTDDVYFASFAALDDEDDVQYEAFVERVDARWQNQEEAPRRLAQAIVRALESRWPDDPDEDRTRAILLASELASLGGFEATVSETGRGRSVYVDARPLTTAILAVLEAVLDQPGIDRGRAVAAALEAAQTLDTSGPAPPPPVEVRPGRDGITDRVRNHGTPLVRTDFTDDLAWNRLVGEASAPQYIEGEEYVVAIEAVSDPALAGLTPETLAADWPEDVYGYVMLADATSMKPGDPTVLYVDLREDRGRSFRCAADQIATVIDNLEIDNVDFEEFAESVGEDGVLRG